MEDTARKLNTTPTTSVIAREVARTCCVLPLYISCESNCSVIPRFLSSMPSYFVIQPGTLWPPSAWGICATERRGHAGHVYFWKLVARRMKIQIIRGILCYLFWYSSTYSIAFRILTEKSGNCRPTWTSPWRATLPKRLSLDLVALQLFPHGSVGLLITQAPRKPNNETKVKTMVPWWGIYDLDFPWPQAWYMITRCVYSLSALRISSLMFSYLFMYCMFWFHGCFIFDSTVRRSYPTTKTNCTGFLDTSSWHWPWIINTSLSAIIPLPILIH